MSFLFEESEKNLINVFQDLAPSNICLIPTDEETGTICDSIVDSKRWKHWIDSSGKDAPPPDFYCPKERLMMEVMRVDDHGFENNGKIINPTYTREHEIERELKETGFFEKFPNLEFIRINADSGLPTQEDHNYQYYLNNFRRTVNRHKAKIKNYRANHPGYKLIFFIFDESTPYMETMQTPIEIGVGKGMTGYLHMWPFDKRFVEVFQNSDIDYLIWFTPYKILTETNAPTLPMACVYKCNTIPCPLREYNPTRMVSTEV